MEGKRGLKVGITLDLKYESHDVLFRTLESMNLKGGVDQYLHWFKTTPQLMTAQEKTLQYAAQMALVVSFKNGRIKEFDRYFDLNSKFLNLDTL